MDFNAKRTAVLFLDRNRFDFYVDGAQNVLSFPFLETIINAMDVINPQELENQIKAFVQQSGINPANIMIILSPNVVFEKDIQAADIQSVEHEIEKFKDSIPFENIYTQSFPLQQNVRIVAVSRDLCDAVKNSFEKLGFSIGAIVSYFALGPQISNMQALDAEVAKQIVKNLDTLKHYSFSIEKTITNAESPAVSKKSPQTSNKIPLRLYLMIGVFILLLVILAVLFLTR